ncbi:MAG: hypothetical protein AAF125_13575, partial [Chloroflexota bacterium]
MVLEGLDDVDWGSLHHAYGPATDVPDMLRGLLSDDENTRWQSWDGLGGAVHHQGDVYDSTVAVIPFLFQLFHDGHPTERYHILHYLLSVLGQSTYINSGGYLNSIRMLTK